MLKKVYYNTVSTRLLSTLLFLMKSGEFTMFRLVGGTSLSLQLGHRESVDIDLFTDSAYDSVDFSAIDKLLKQNFSYVDTFDTEVIGMGKSYYIGDSANHCVKLDLFYTDTFIRPIIQIDELRLAGLEEIIAMKIDVVARIGRKKDFWDIHELLDEFSIQKMLDLHEERYPYAHNREEIVKNFTNFKNADLDFNPICLKGKYWELIKLDIVEKIQHYNNELSSS
ncbi:MAG: nucleotidyl transferase AbiEii/AbiGii toxin family protein [Paludibacter sp.]